MEARFFTGTIALMFFIEGIMQMEKKNRQRAN